MQRLSRHQRQPWFWDDPDDGELESLHCTHDNQSHVNVGLGLECVVDTHHWCLVIDQKAEDIFSVADWFYPFSIEFSIVVVAIWYIMWSHIGQIHQHHATMGFVPETQSDIEQSYQQGHKMILFADCSSSTKGLFVGLIILALTVIGCIIVVVIMDDCNDDLVIEVTLMFEIFLFSLMTAASITLYYKLGM